MKNIVITGNIGCGKSTFTNMLKEYLPQYQVCDIDAEVHKWYDDPNVQAFLLANIGATDRATVSDIVFADARKRTVLQQFFTSLMTVTMYQLASAGNCIFDFPLYYELGSEPLMNLDVTVVVTVYCDPDIQRTRVMARGRFTEDKLDRILTNQLSSAAKVALADFSIDTGAPSADAEMKKVASRLALMASVSDLQIRFTDTFGEANLVMWGLIVSQYGRSNRSYHSISHLTHLFNEYDKVKVYVKDQLAVELAIWYHDIIYNTDVEQYPRNELNSANTMYRELHKFQPRLVQDKLSSIQLAVEMIVSTIGHRITSPWVQSRPDALHDCQLFLDMDLSSLAASREAALAMDDKIRNEFSQYGDLEFAQGRIKAMQPFYDRPKLFLSEVYAPLEETAKSNLEAILQRYTQIVDKERN